MRQDADHRHALDDLAVEQLEFIAGSFGRILDRRARRASQTERLAAN
jgi:hypothetical protein